MKYVFVSDIEDLWEGEMKAVQVHGRDYLLIKTAGKIVAYLNRCPHQKAQLSRGCMAGGVLTCSAHGWQFDPATGHGINPKNAALTSVPLKLENGGIWLQVEPESESVGPVLQATPLGRHVADILVSTNFGAVVVDRGSYVRVLVPGRCVLNRKRMEAALKREFSLPQDLEMIMPSFKGQLQLSEDEVIWYAKTP